MEQQHKGFSEGLIQVWGDKIQGLFYHLQEPIYDIVKDLMKFKKQATHPPRPRKKKNDYYSYRTSFH